ncbi:MAG: alpha/beta hydrolase [Pseudomonadota bacterium]
MIEHNITISPYWNIRKLQIVPKHRVSYLEFGDPNNKEVALCIHGISRNAHDFDYLSQALSKDFRVISINMPGRGSSEWFKNAKYYNYHTYIHDILHILKKLRIPSVHYVGTSMGGLIGMAIATYYRKYIKTLVINDVGPEIPKSTIVRMEKYLGLDPVFDTEDAAKVHMKMILKNFGISEDVHWDYITKNSIALRSDGKYRLHYDPRVLEGKSEERRPSRYHDQNFIDLWYIWHKVIHPLLLIHGENSDILLSSTIAKMQSTRDFDIHRVANAGHAPALFDVKDIEVIHKWLTLKSSL